MRMPLSLGPQLQHASIYGSLVQKYDDKRVLTGACVSRRPSACAPAHIKPPSSGCVLRVAVRVRCVSL